MPRPLRYALVDIPQHVVQRGNNRQRAFFTRRDRRRYLAWAGVAARECGCDIHAYVLMTNHVHMLVTPREPMAVAGFMQSLGRRYVRYLNDSRGRTGTLWEGRYHASLVASGEYLMNCYRYIELNPVRAGMVGDPGTYAWSSFAHNALGRRDQLIVEHPEFVALGDDSLARASCYRELFAAPLGPEALKLIRDSLGGCDAYGPDAFKQEVAARLGIAGKKTRNGT